MYLHICCCHYNIMHFLTKKGVGKKKTFRMSIPRVVHEMNWVGHFSAARRHVAVRRCRYWPWSLRRSFRRQFNTFKTRRLSCAHHARCLSLHRLLVFFYRFPRFRELVNGLYIPKDSINLSIKTGERTRQEVECWQTRDAKSSNPNFLPQKHVTHVQFLIIDQVVNFIATLFFHRECFMSAARKRPKNHLTYKRPIIETVSSDFSPINILFPLMTHFDIFIIVTNYYLSWNWKIRGR